MALLDLGRCSDAFVAEVRRHPDVGDHHLGIGLTGPSHQFVVVAGDPNHLDVVGHREQRPDPFPNDQVVVGQEY
jgi:hypothetical protein